MIRRLLTAAVLLAVAVALPQWLWLGTYIFEHHEHTTGDVAALAAALVHGHEHEEGIPDHQHHLLPSPLLRLDAPRNLHVPVVASLAGPETGAALPLALAVLPHDRIRLPGSGPPRLQLLCTLLI